LQNTTENKYTETDLRFQSNRRVYLLDRLAEGVITLGGMAVLAAVLGIMVYLVWVVFPLTKSGKVQQIGKTSLRDSSVMLVLDEYQRLGTILTPEGVLRSFALDSGDQIGEPNHLGSFTAFSFAPESNLLALGYPSGELSVATLGYKTKILSGRTVPESGQSLGLSDMVRTNDGILERTGEDQYRLITPKLSISEQISEHGSTSKPIAVDAEVFGRSRILAVVRADSTGSVITVTERKSLVGGSSTTQTKSLPLDFESELENPIHVVLLNDGKQVLIAWEDGTIKRFAKGNDSYGIAESFNVTEDSEHITSLKPLLGRGTILVGTSEGRVYTLMLTRDSPDDASHLVHVSTFNINDQPVTALAISQRDRTFAAGDFEGRIRLWHATSGKQICSTISESGAVDVLSISPKLDGFHASSQGGISSWQLEPGHPNATLKSLFLPVWYEGDPAPSLVYQSTAADDSAESKISLTPLIFGTFKATLFAMLFAVPIAVMAAIYASEFMSKSMRSKVKPTVEMMASLPSVVLGFIAAMIVAPFARDHLSAILVGLVVVPTFLLLSSSMWPLLPGNLAWRVPHSIQFWLVVIFCFFGILLSARLGPAVDRALFSLQQSEEMVLTGFVEPADILPQWAENKNSFTLADRTRLRRDNLFVLDGIVVQPIELQDKNTAELFESRRHDTLAGEPPFKTWLNGIVGSPVPGWMALVFVPSLVLAGVAAAGFKRKSNSNWLPLVRVIGMILVAFPLAYAIAQVLSSLGLDARESLLGTFTQRNTFVVGVIMGFAVIPIIFTISDDALQSVPNTLRSASLGAGATKWQTAIRIVLPVAASGIFSAIMIGLGRAAGETMIVLMATGNTPVMDWNIFGGLRTLSANIAVELPEAERGGTHYRVLFLCGVVLFAITFVINTTAEIIRQHFRKRSAML
jgi:phosphate transport system permease protein